MVSPILVCPPPFDGDTTGGLTDLPGRPRRGFAPERRNDLDQHSFVLACDVLAPGEREPLAGHEPLDALDGVGVSGRIFNSKPFGYLLRLTVAGPSCPFSVRFIAHGGAPLAGTPPRTTSPHESYAGQRARAKKIREQACRPPRALV